ncbi:MAG: Ig-like domain-containing protein [Planctomycetes bacterium]|nr:Ig-like domain-containing protein [Planctomycetota bacterium]
MFDEPVNQLPRICTVPAPTTTGPNPEIPAGATLLGVRVRAQFFAADGRLSFENLDTNNTCNPNPTGTTQVFVRSDGAISGTGFQNPSNCNPTAICTATLPNVALAVSDGTADPIGAGDCSTPGNSCAGAGACAPVAQPDGSCVCGSGWTLCCPNPTISNTICDQCITDTTALNAYRAGTAFVRLDEVVSEQAAAACSKGVHQFRIRTGLCVTAQYVYCLPNLPPCANPDTATICPSNNLDCAVSAIDIPVLANDCDPQHCGTTGGSGQINCNSLRLCSQVTPTNCGLTTIFDSASQATAVAGDPATFVWKAEVTLGGGTGTNSCATAPPASACTPTGSNCAGTFVRFTPGRRGGGLQPATTVSFNYRISDADPTTPLTSDGTVFITVCNPPDAVNDCIVVCKDVTTPTIFNVLANDTDGEAFDPIPAGFPTCACSPIDPASLSIIGGTVQGDGSVRIAGGTVRINQGCGTVTTNCDVSCASDTPTASCANRCLSYVPDPGSCGTFTFQYRILDVGSGSQRCCDTATVTVRVIAPNAVPDTAIVCEDRPSTCSGNATCDAGCTNHSVTIPVLANDSLYACTVPPITGDAINCGSVTFPGLTDLGGGVFQTSAGGRVRANQTCGAAPNNGCPSGCVTYTPPANYCGTDTFSYQFTANYAACQTPATPQSPSSSACPSNPATVTVTIKPAPRVLDDNLCAVLTQANGFSQTFDVLANDGGAPPVACGPVAINASSLVLLCTNPPPNCSATACPATGGHGTFEVVTDGGTKKIKFTQNPANPLPPNASESICYKVFSQPSPSTDPACCAIARLTITNCTCPPSNRRECSSLLLFPEFDNRPGRVTMITVTDGCCAEAGSIPFRVQFKFVRADTCLTSDFYKDLTICDTLTFLTSSVNSGGTTARGYLYAYVSDKLPATNNPTGSPIVYNHIIGQELLLDSIESLDYSMNAVGFKGLGAPLSLNDDDLDGIRDFNGLASSFPEYEELPDTIKIPRYFGQDWNNRDRGIYKSRLILVNMSGGRAFTTTINLSIFNDNEYAFSSQYTFYCWDKPYLKDISGSFLEQNLDFSDNDPDELVGMPDKETGWFTIDGDVAVSSAETIHDPAVYAVLVEVTGHYSAADLPWECDCQQGDLLPLSILGDGGNTAPGAAPINGDNQ